MSLHFLSSRFGNSNKTLPKQQTNPKPYNKLSAQSVELKGDAGYEMVRPVVSAVLKQTFHSFLNLADTSVLFAEMEQ
jgi:hypothetical protein